MAPYQQAAAVAEAGSDAADPATGVEDRLAVALLEVSKQLDAPGLPGDQRMRLLQRQAELGDLRDELELRTRRRLAARR
jgi:hypothetical protein